MDNHALLSALLQGPQTGVNLAAHLGVSRNAVWKRIEHLRQSGLPIDASETHGYALLQPTALLSRDAIFSAMDAEARNRIRHLQIFFETDSTQTLALAQRAPEFGMDVWLAETQRAGQGRRGKTWVSPPLSSIYCSINRRMNCSIAAMSGFSLACAVMLVEALQGAGITGLSLKWPNDIWLNNKKCAGLLIQVRGEMNGPCDVTLGFGVNVNISDNAGKSIDQAWTSLDKEYQRVFNRNDLLANILPTLLRGFEAYEQMGLSAFIERWRSMDGLQGRLVEIHNAAQIQVGTARGIDDNGALLLEQNGELQPIHSGDVSVRVQHG